MKKVSLKKVIICSSISLVMSTVMIVGTAIAYNYASLLDTALSTSGYSQGTSESQLCKEVVEEGIVLLKNEDGALPLKSTEKKVALLGQDSVDFVYGGAGSGSVDTSRAPNLRKAFQDTGFEVNQDLWDFYTTGVGKTYRKKTPDESGKGTFEVNEVPSSLYSTELKESLNSDDVGICVIGRSGGESSDLPTSTLSSGSKYLQIDNNEKDMIKLACSKFDKVILIVNSNNPMELSLLEDEQFKNVKAAIWVGGVGQEGLYAIAEVLNGTINPSGRLVDTYAYDSTSAPSFKNLGNYTIENSTVTNGQKYLVYSEGIYVGYRYYETRYEDKILNQGNTSTWDYSKQVQYPFGYGLSYSDFSWSDFNVKPINDGKDYQVSVKVSNNSEVSGKDVVQIYAQKPFNNNGVEKASVELVGFKKTDEIKPHRSEEVKITISKKDFTSYDYKGAKTYILDSGKHYLAAGRNCHDALNNILSLKGKSTSDGMDEKGSSSLAKIAFEQNEVDKKTYAISEQTSKPIENRFEDCDINYYQPHTYLSRSDWQNTFPTTFANGNYNASDKLLNDLKFYNVEDDRSDDTQINSFTFKTNSTQTSYKVADLIDVDYSDSKWDDIINQLSWVQQTKLIRLGGYSTIQVDRIGLPATQDKDGPSGISGTLVGGTSCMAWPAEVVMASTFNEEIIEKLGTLFGEDSIQAGVAGVYGPGADIHRSPYSGRNFEYFSEDPILSKKMAASEMKGLRSKGVIAYVKHFALNDQETNRYGVSIFANEQQIREICLKGFEGAIVDGKATALMAAMNRVGARWVGAHKGMMTSVLRDEWGFKGMSITDQASVASMFYQDMKSGLWAGNDMWLNTNESYWSLEDCKNDKTMQYYIHRAAKNIVYSVGQSWAVNEKYKTGIDSDIKTFPWRTVLLIADLLVWLGSAAWISVPLVFYLLDKKKEKEDPSKTVEENKIEN